MQYPIDQLGVGSIQQNANYTNAINTSFKFSNTQYTSSSKVVAGKIEIKSDDDKTGETATVDAALVNDLRLLLDCINQLSDDHPLGALKLEFHTRKALKLLGSKNES